jgi:3-oxoacyl-[acyl-carrier protein] reductase
MGGVVTIGRIALVTGGAGSIASEVSRVLASDGGQVVVADNDLTAEQSVADLFAAVEADAGPIATLVCVLGSTPAEPGTWTRIATTTLDTWIEAEALNARATFLCVREFLGGRIVTVVSSAALQPGAANGAADATSKAGVLALTRIASLEAGPLGITVNAIVLGSDDTRASEVAEAVCFLSSADARHITGTTIAVDGGSHLTP